MEGKEKNTSLCHPVNNILFLRLFEYHPYAYVNIANTCTFLMRCAKDFHLFCQFSWWLV